MIYALIIFWAINGHDVYTIIPYDDKETCEVSRKQLEKERAGQIMVCRQINGDPIKELRKFRKKS